VAISNVLADTSASSAIATAYQHYVTANMVGYSNEDRPLPVERVGGCPCANLQSEARKGSVDLALTSNRAAVVGPMQ
jgi:hypothetical protein